MWYKDEYVVGLKKAQADLAVDFAGMPEAAKAYVLEYGLRQVLNDAMSSGDKAKPDECKAMALKKLDALMRGEIRAQREGGGSADPVGREAMRLAVNVVKANPKFVAWLQANGLKPTEMDAVAKLGELAKGLAAREDIRKQAEANMAAIASMDFDI